MVTLVARVRRWPSERTHPGRGLAAPIAVVAVLLVLYVAVRATGGAPNALIHFGYVAVVVAAVTRGLRGGTIAGLAAGMLFGPMMPLGVAGNVEFLGQWAWLVRLVAFTAAGLLVGGIAERSQKMALRIRAAEERRRSEVAVRASEERLRHVVEASPVGMVVLDETAHITIVNAVAERLFGAPAATLIGTTGTLSPRVMTPGGEVLDNLGAIARRAIRAGLAAPPLDVVVESPSGESVVASMEIVLLRGAHDRPIGSAITFRDVTADRALEARRTTHYEDLQRVSRLAFAEPTASAACERLLVEFARIWPVVNAVIYTFTLDDAHRLAEWARPGLGFRHPARASAAEASRLRELAESGRPVRVSVEQLVADQSARDAILRHGGRTSIIVPLLADGALVGALLATDTQAGERILDVAESGSLADFGQVCAAVVVRALAGEATADRDARERVGLILERPERILPVFQPIVSLTDGRIAGYEALSRFQAEPYEPPNVWFARAKAVGLGFELQALAIHRALRVAMAAGLPAAAFLSVNASPGLLADPLLARALSGFPLNRLVIEITEEEAVSDYGTLRDGIGWLRAADARIAIDDVGAGYASLRHVTELRPDFVKLDALLTPRLGGDQAARAMARALSGFAEEIGAVMIAEGVERPEDLEVLAGTRLPIMVQGYAIARPGAPWPQILPAALEVWTPAGAGRRRATIGGRPGVGATQQV